NAILGVALGGGHLVVVRETQLVVLQMKDGIGAPLVRIVWPAARAQSPAPLVGKHDFVPIVRERSRVPIGIVRVVHRIDALWMHRVLDVQHNSVSGARARCQPNCRVHGDVVALVCVLRFLCAFPAVSAPVIQAVHRTGLRMSEMSKILTPRKRSFCAAGMRGFLSLSLSSPAGGGGSGGNPWTPQSSRPFGISTDMNSRFLYTDTSPCPPGHTMEVTNLA